MVVLSLHQSEFGKCTKEKETIMDGRKFPRKTKTDEILASDFFSLVLRTSQCDNMFKCFDEFPTGHNTFWVFFFATNSSMSKGRKVFFLTTR